jgi:hypothetical protein
MMRKLSSGLGISLEVLAQKYPLSEKISTSKLTSDAVSIHEDRKNYK